MLNTFLVVVTIPTNKLENSCIDKKMKKVPVAPQMFCSKISLRTEGSY